MSERIGELAGVIVSTSVGPDGPQVEVLTLNGLNGATMTGAQAATLAGIILRAAYKVNARRLDARRKGTP